VNAIPIILFENALPLTRDCKRQKHFTHLWRQWPCLL